MIKVTRLNGERVVVNADFIEFIEPTPDTVITLTTGKKMMVHETVDEVIDRVIEYRQRVGCSARADGIAARAAQDVGAAPAG